MLLVFNFNHLVNKWMTGECERHPQQIWQLIEMLTIYTYYLPKLDPMILSVHCYLVDGAIQWWKHTANREIWQLVVFWIIDFIKDQSSSGNFAANDGIESLQGPI